MVDTARFAMKSSTGAHDAPALVDLKMPPPTLPANMLFVFDGSITTARTRPPMLPGPSHVQEELLIPAESAAVPPVSPLPAGALGLSAGAAVPPTAGEAAGAAPPPRGKRRPCLCARIASACRRPSISPFSGTHPFSLR